MDTPSFDDRSPIYQQIADRIKNDILSGALAEGEQVMSTNQYAAFYRINPATAAKGFHLLIEEGILHKRRGIGMFVSDQAQDTLRSERRRRFFAEVLDPMLAEARVIGIPLADIMQHIHAGGSTTEGSTTEGSTTEGSTTEGSVHGGGEPR